MSTVQKQCQTFVLFHYFMVMRLKKQTPRREKWEAATHWTVGRNRTETKVLILVLVNSDTGLRFQLHTEERFSAGVVPSSASVRPISDATLTSRNRSETPPLPREEGFKDVRRSDFLFNRLSDLQLWESLPLIRAHITSIVSNTLQGSSWASIRWGESLRDRAIPKEPPDWPRRRDCKWGDVHLGDLISVFYRRGEEVSRGQRSGQPGAFWWLHSREQRAWRRLDWTGPAICMVSFLGESIFVVLSEY